MTKMYAKGVVQLKSCCEAIMMLSPDKEWQIEVKKRTKTRTNSQNNLMWLWLDDIAKKMSDATGYEKDEIHELFKQNFLKGKIIEVEGLKAEKVTTTKLTVEEMSEYLDRVQRFCAQEMGIFVPLPEELHRRG